MYITYEKVNTNTVTRTVPFARIWEFKILHEKKLRLIMYPLNGQVKVRLIQFDKDDNSIIKLAALCMPIRKEEICEMSSRTKLMLVKKIL